MRKLHCCECIQHAFIIILPSSVFIFSFFAAIPPIYRVFFLVLLLQNCRRHPWVANPHPWWCLQRLQLLFICLHMDQPPLLPLGHSWTTHGASCPLLLLAVLTLLKPSVPTRREQPAEMISVDTTALPALWGRVRSSLCLLQGWEWWAHPRAPAGRRGAAAPALPSGGQNIILLTPHCPANPAGCYSRKFTLSNLFIDCIPGPAGICLSRACDQGSDRNPSYCRAGFQSGRPWAPPFHLLIYLICLPFVLICFWDYRTPALALCLWLHKLWRFKCFSARFLQTCFFSPPRVYNLENQYVSAFSTTCKQNWIHIGTEGWIGFYWQILKLTFITSQRSQVNFFS